MLNPVARALDLDQFGLLEVREHAGGPGSGRKLSLPLTNSVGHWMRDHSAM